MSAEVADAIRQTRRTLAAKTWVPREPSVKGEINLLEALRATWFGYETRLCTRDAICLFVDSDTLAAWNDRQTDVGAVLGMTLQALIAELCKVAP
jgi:hypothetical protein